jgi:hypothetical protein
MEAIMGAVVAFGALAIPSLWFWGWSVGYKDGRHIESLGQRCDCLAAKFRDD